MKSRIITILGFALLSACGAESLRSMVAPKSIPYVVAMTPSESEINSSLKEIRVQLSQPVRAESVAENSLFVIPAAVRAEYQEDEWDDLAEDINDGDVEVVAAEIAVSSDALEIIWTAQSPVTAEGDYVFMALPTIFSIDRFPLDQMQAGAQSSPFEKTISIRNGFSESGNEAEHEMQNGDVSQTDLSENPNVLPDTDNADGDAEIQIPHIPYDFNRVFISEIVTDPQQDHGESAPGNGVLFDSLAGKGTVGSTDEFLEIVNGTSAPVDLTGWNVVMKDGSDVTQEIKETGWSLFFSQGGAVTGFLQDEVLVLGNPEGDLKNTVTVELHDGAGNLVDSIYLEDGNAESIEDEAFRLDPVTETWVQDFSDPGEF